MPTPSNSSKKRPNDNSSNVNNAKRSKEDIKRDKLLKELFALDNSNSDLTSFANNLNTARKDRNKEYKIETSLNIKETVECMTPEKEAKELAFGFESVKKRTTYKEKRTKEGNLRTDFMGVNKISDIKKVI